MTRPTAVALLAVVVVLAFLLMAHGWRTRASAQALLAAPDPVPPGMVERVRSEGVEATYVSTTAAVDWLDRISAHGLGTRSHAHVLVEHAGVAVVREGAAGIYVPAERMRDVRRESVRAGKAVPGGGLLVWDWSLGDTLVSTAVRPRRSTERDALESGLRQLLSGSREHKTGETP